MSPPDLEQALRATLADRRLTRSERDALRSVIADLHGDLDRLAQVRSMAFALAREAIDEAPAQRERAAVFDWLEAVNKLLLPPPSEPAPRSEAHFSPGDACLRRILGLLGASRTRADICVFTITDDRIAEALIEAHGRGVALRILTDDDKAHDRGSDIDRLERAGVPVRVDHSPHHMHHKFAVFDERTLLTGSYNWTRSAADHNHENVIVTDDPRLARAFRDVFDALWQQL